MGKRKVDPEKKRAAVARVLSGSTSYGDESKRLGVAKSTLHEAAQKIKPGADAPPPAAGDSPLEAAQKAAGVKGAAGSSNVPLTADEVKLAGADALKQDQDWCVSQLNQVKSMSVLGVAWWYDVPILTEPRLTPLLSLGPKAEEATRTAAPELAPLLRKYFPDGSLLIGLVVALAMDGAGTFQGIKPLIDEQRKKREMEAASKLKKTDATVKDPPA
jgi:transposase-like protein